MPQAVRTRIESIIGAKGTYVPDEGAFKLRFPRTDIFPGMRGQRGYSAFPPALRSRNFKFISIRNHTVGEHPQLIFVHYTGEGPAVKLAEAVRHVLNVQVGIVEPHT